MIIRVTIHDNDYTQVILDYFKYFSFRTQLRPDNYYDLPSIKEMKEIDEFTNKVFYDEDKLTKEELSKIENIIREKILKYLQKNTNEKFELKEIEVECKMEMKIGKWNNDEMIYYISLADTAIAL